MRELPASVDLHVQGHLSVEDAARQHRSAMEILQRFTRQPGVILGDEVGMGKTFVALAVAAAFAVHDPSRPVVVMVPSAVLPKWQRDAATFREACLTDAQARSRFRVRPAHSGVEFLKLLDDPIHEKASVILLPHGALHRKLGDGWVKLAILRASIKGRREVDPLRQRLARFGPMLLKHATAADRHFDLYMKLLHSPLDEWRRIIGKAGLPVSENDDPVPLMFDEILGKVELDDVFRRVVQVLPERRSDKLTERIQRARRALDNTRDGVVLAVWRKCLGSMRHDLPLLILDEAHRARHAGTRLAALLQEQEESESSGGQLAGAFDRMLFLTATPFQLGHIELHSVLSRFSSIRWTGPNVPSMLQGQFREEIDDLLEHLNAMQLATDRLERAWKSLLAADIEEAVLKLGEGWWSPSPEQLGSTAPEHMTNERVLAVMRNYGNAAQAIRKAEQGLRKWVLRHARPVHLPHSGQGSPVLRRLRMEGASVRAEIGAQSDGLSGGLRISGESVLPFFLAARLSTIPEKIQVFAEGIASSFEALLDTGQEDLPAPDDVIPQAPLADTKGASYLLRMREAARMLESRGYTAHPKLATTVDLAMWLWQRGEKVLIFNQYRQTGGALHRALSERMLDNIESGIVERFSCARSEVEATIERLSRRWDRGLPHANAARDILDSLLDRHPGVMSVPADESGADAEGRESMGTEALLSPDEVRETIQDVLLRFLRTPTFLLRYAPGDDGVDHDDYVRRCFGQADASGLTLLALTENFLRFLASRPSAYSRQEYLRALLKVQTGTHAGREVEEAFAGDASVIGSRLRLAPNVRRVFGDTKYETRQRIMLTFNTPFYPEILIASSVMAEGVDLHLNCRHVIHHDLDWNPSSLEQRTGRVDRLGAKSEQCSQPIHVYIPYLEGCQDEKLFRVVTDRERWFGVVMGGEKSMEQILNATAWERERLAAQPPIPEGMVRELTMSLGI